MINNFQFLFLPPFHPELPEVIALSIGSVTSDKIVNTLALYKNPHRHLLGYFIKDKLIGVIGFEIKVDRVLIKHLAVRREGQKQGIGTSLLNFVIDYYPELVLEVETDDEAVQFYRKNYFECIALKGKHSQRYKCMLKIR